VVIRDCPPGLAKKSPPCIPPGRVKHDFAVGRRVPADVSFVSFSHIPVSVRSRFALRSSDRFIHRGDSLVVVNPRTRVVSRVVAVRF
jgi:hypothetical protein